MLFLVLDRPRNATRSPNVQAWRERLQSSTSPVKETKATKAMSLGMSEWVVKTTRGVAIEDQKADGAGT